MSRPVEVLVEDRLATVALNDPVRRNAMTVAMFDALDETLDALREHDDVSVVLLCGRGRAFCAGFDVVAAAEDPTLLTTYIERLGELLRRLRRQPQVVVAAVQGAAIAGGCAMVSACDVVVVSAGARLGYPVHGLGLSPAVTTSSLLQAVGPGAARAILMGGELFDGHHAYALGLADRLSPDDASVLDDARSLGRQIAGHGPEALRATKLWLNELDGSLDDDRYRAPARDSGASAPAEARTLLPAFLERKRHRG